MQLINKQSFYNYRYGIMQITALIFFSIALYFFYLWMQSLGEGPRRKNENRYLSTLSTGIDFKKNGFPVFLKKISGVSNLEPWGRWTDANLGPIASLEFYRALPNKFKLELVAFGFNAENNRPVKIRVGSEEKMIFLSNVGKYYSLNFENNEKVNLIEIIPLMPSIPYQLDPKNTDTRALGVGLERIKIITLE
jgi:phosphoglycerol transferase